MWILILTVLINHPDDPNSKTIIKIDGLNEETCKMGEMMYNYKVETRELGGKKAVLSYRANCVLMYSI